MNGAHWHLAVNHLPLIFPIVGIIVLITGFLVKSEVVKRVALMIFALGAVATIFAMNTGEGAEHVVEKISGIEERYIETHEEKAELFAIASYALGFISLIGIWLSARKRNISSIIIALAGVVALAVLYLGKETGTSGGEIRHTEIRTNTTIPATNTHAESEHN